MRRGAIFIVLAGLLAACGGGDPAPFAESRTPPGLAERFYPPEGWAWGLVKVGDAPAQRYGVGAPASVPRANILILPDYGETAETWFETARDFNRRGYVVWILEGAGQGGSGRLVLPRDLGYAESFAPDVAAVQAMVSTVIRPGARAPLAIVGQGVGALIARLAVRQGLEPAALILSAPSLDPRLPGAPGALARVRLLHLDRLRVIGTSAWRGTMKDAFARRATHDRRRGAVTLAWQHANPDLRMGGPSLRWQAALHAAQLTARRELAAIAVPTLVVEGDRGEGCLTLARCSAIRLPGAGSALELETDSARDAWLAAISVFLRGRLAGDESKGALQAGPPPIASAPPTPR